MELKCVSYNKGGRGVPIITSSRYSILLTKDVVIYYAWSLLLMKANWMNLCWERAGEGNPPLEAQTSPFRLGAPLLWTSIDIWGSKILFCGVRTLWDKHILIHILFMDFSSVLHGGETHGSFSFYILPFFFLPKLQHPLLVWPEVNRKEVLSAWFLFFSSWFYVRLHSQGASDFPISDNFWPLAHRNHHKLDFLPLFWPDNPVRSSGLTSFFSQAIPCSHSSSLGQTSYFLLFLYWGKIHIPWSEPF